ncbi:MAG: hypothetical protein AMXMBFR33_46940 [Candidatus Xenobia bacterium]
MMRLLVVLLALSTMLPALAREELYFPYREAGLSREEAAAHLLNRFSYGPRPGQVAEVARGGLEAWFEGQLTGDLTSPELGSALLAVPEESNEWTLRARKLLRAVYNQNQLHEVLTDFWFNHFNVSLTDDDCRQFVASYEREAIRPNILGPFRELLGATAHHPCMLYYLDNAYSQAPATGTVEMESNTDPLGYSARRGKLRPTPRPPDPNQRKGLNENYARELLELHTLGVDGGYRQKDVTEVARVLTGWSVERTAGKASFVFRPEWHDDRPKRVMGSPTQASGQQEGEKLLDTLAMHPSTARFLCRKLAVRFVSDSPPRSLLTRLERTYLRRGGDLKAVVVELVESPEFWDRSVVKAKVKSPFELAASSVRILNARLEPRSGVVGFLEPMGQELYACRPPTGFPDRADYWINTGNLLNRMNFCLQLASGRVNGARVDLSELRPGRSPRTVEEALSAYARCVLPGRDVKGTVEQLMPAALDPEFARRVTEAATARGGSAKAYPQAQPSTRQKVELTPESTANVVGILLGSPEFQRR